MKSTFIIMECIDAEMLVSVHIVTLIVPLFCVYIIILLFFGCVIVYYLLYLMLCLDYFVL